MPSRISALRWNSKRRSTPTIVRSTSPFPAFAPAKCSSIDIVTVIHTALAPGEFWADYDFDKNNITSTKKSTSMSLPTVRSS